MTPDADARGFAGLMRTRGGVVSTRNDLVAGVASSLRTWSLALTPSVCAPSPRLAVVNLAEHALYAPPSTLHLNDEAPVPPSEKVGVLTRVSPDGTPDTVVTGACVSTTKIL